MSLINLKCLNCGAELKGDAANKVMRCPHCSSVFQVESAANYYNNTYQTNNYINASVVNLNGANAASLIRRGFIILEDGEFSKAEKLFNDALDLEPENGEGYLGLLLVKLRVKTKEELGDEYSSFADLPEYNKVVRFGDENTKNYLNDCLNKIADRRNKEKYDYASSLLRYGSTELTEKAKTLFTQLGDYSDSAERVKQCEQTLQGFKKKRNVKAIVCVAIALVLLLIIIVSCSVNAGSSSGLMFRINDDYGYTVYATSDFSGRNVKIPSTHNGREVTEIGENAFKNCKSIKKVTIPDSVDYIGKSAFYGCRNLESVKFKGSGWWKCYASGVRYDYNDYGYTRVSVSDKGENADYLTITYSDCEWVRGVKYGYVG